jgi:hypothetical protein
MSSTERERVIETRGFEGLLEFAKDLKTIVADPEQSQYIESTLKPMEYLKCAGNDKTAKSYVFAIWEIFMQLHRYEGFMRRHYLDSIERIATEMEDYVFSNPTEVKGRE